MSQSWNDKSQSGIDVSLIGNDISQKATRYLTEKLNNSSSDIRDIRRLSFALLLLNTVSGN